MTSVRDSAAVRVPCPLPTPLRRGRKPGGPRKSRPVETLRVDPAVLTVAQGLVAERDVRLVIDPDGSVVVRNGAPRACPVCGATQEHHVDYVRRTGQCVV